MRSGSIIRQAALGVIVLASAACTPARQDPERIVVAEVDGHRLTLAAFQSYVDASLPHEAFEEPLSPADAVRVRSRLFDDFVNEAILLAEAESLGLQAEPGEIDAWLNGGGASATGPPAHGEAERERARREVVIQKLLESELVDRAGTGVEPPASGETPAPSGEAQVTAVELLARSKAKRRVILYTEKLPFPYVEDATGTDREGGS